MIFGALLVSVALCNQSFGFELLDRMLGLNCGGCGECKACAKVACCEKACPKACVPACEKACPKACVPACEKACPKPCVPVCEKACPKTCEPACNGFGKCKRQHCTPVRDLFDGLCDMFEAKGCITEEPKCVAPKACEKACAPKACEKACKVACEPTCEKAPKTHKLYRRPVVELLEALFCCDNGCEAGCEVGCAGTTTTTKAAPAAAPAKPAEKAAPLPAAPKADPSASIQSRGIYQASNSLVRN
jgi:hypothetical protein